MPKGGANLQYSGYFGQEAQILPKDQRDALSVEIFLTAAQP